MMHYYTLNVNSNESIYNGNIDLELFGSLKTIYDTTDKRDIVKVCAFLSILNQTNH